MKCQHNNCWRDATGPIALRIPATGMPLAEHDPIKCVVGLQVCDECFGTLKAADFLSEQMKKAVNIATMLKVPPDFDKAFLEHLSYDDKDWKILKKHSRNVS